MRQVMILCMEDEPMVLATRTMVLEASGFAVIAAAHVREALELLSGEVIDAVVLDSTLAEVDAGAIAAIIKRLKPQVRIVMMSPQPAALDGNTCADALLTKGESPQKLLDALRALVSE